MKFELFTLVLVFLIFIFIESVGFAENDISQFPTRGSHPTGRSSPPPLRASVGAAISAALF